MEHSYSYYSGYNGTDQASGAYIFRPNATFPIKSQGQLLLGLARWQPDGDKGEATRVIGTFGYLAPEYAESGEVTEKADVYSFGVVHLELVSGRKVVDINRPKGQQCLTEWVTRVYKEKEHAEVEFIIGPIPIDDGVGKEITTQITSALKTNKTFYTDSNRKDFIKRVRDFRTDWELQVNEPVAGNYYPVDSFAYLPPNSKHHFRSYESSALVVFERRYAYLEDHIPKPIVGSNNQQPLLDTPGEEAHYNQHGIKKIRSLATKFLYSDGGEDLDQQVYNGSLTSKLRSSWIKRKLKNTEVDVRIMYDEVTIKLVQQKRSSWLKRKLKNTD
ncbi:unnamed protein product [Lactuca virosa]|uniref:Protein kinase domain-containing protein n=1 Tax=Lactuca virosa TaxID=75947 RepID=A0AAU9LYT9_9ASTR|nr:unnamed protein product [Lactuca virosa]